jgi:hypothetical protein
MRVAMMLCFSGLPTAHFLPLSTVFDDDDGQVCANEIGPAEKTRVQNQVRNQTKAFGFALHYLPSFIQSAVAASLCRRTPNSNRPPRGLRIDDRFSSPEGFARVSKGVLGTDALNLPAAKFFKSSLSFGKPQRFGIGLNLIINSRNQTLGELNTIS